ncbi:hypothetical protein ARMGADRAFT_1048413 [Armillaria gallica]|uniref:Reverse transcriptase domain-containing protein n=1 Tax=Armillaria gallica TaxID=47427 RepID=A0A2H3CYJ5_ARMGA|nr:hypothetical protein ARMGADRAFT_1048413 [Armillaria gallica]
MNTIKNYPHLFNVSTPIEVDHFESLLFSHPNTPFVQSVMTSLCEGFWPWVNTKHSNGYPETWDNSWAPPATMAEQSFLANQRDIEIEKKRFSPPFGPDLLPGMYSTPVLAVPKPHSDKLRLVSHQSCGTFSQNSMIDKDLTRGPWMDTLHQFIPALLHFHREHGKVCLVLWKSDVSKVFHHHPPHPLWQIKQVITTNIPTKVEIDHGTLIRTVDWCSCFGSCASPQNWASIMGLVIWVAIFVKSILDLFCYVDDTWSWEIEDELTWYEPYQCFYLTKQARFLALLNELRVPHERRKQLWGAILTVIRFLIDVNEMTVTLPPESKVELVTAICKFIDTSSRRRTVRWMTWSLNVFPLLKPALCNVYEKISGRHEAYKLYLNEAVKGDLEWFLHHIQASPGILLFDALDWDPEKETNLTILCDACMAGMGFWIPELLLGFFTPVPCDPPKDTIFFWEALCVVVALEWFCKSMRQDSTLTHWLRVTIKTDNSNTVDLFDSLCALPAYNSLLRTSVDLLISSDIDLHVLHIPGVHNVVADAISFSRTARQPPRMPWSLDELVHKCSIVLGLALDNASQSSYSSALNSYLMFCALHSFPIEPTTDTLSFFVVYMSHHIEPRSVGSYLSGIISQLEPHFPNVHVVRNSMLVAHTLKGCKRLHSKPIRPKQPISRDHLRHALCSLNPLSSYNDVLFVAMLFTGFYGLLHLGEMTMPDNTSLWNPCKYSRRSSVEWIPEGFAFWLPMHKTDTMFEGSCIVIPHKDNVSVNAVPTFCRIIPDRGFAGQSTCSGGATALAEDGVSPHLIQASGRWSSDTFQIYIRKNPTILQALLHARR